VMTDMAAKEKCPRFNGCEATLCPLVPTDPSWYPDESVCPRRSSDTFIVPQWLVTQRKIAKKKLTFEAGYFTCSMMDRNIRVSKGIKGLNPNKPFSTEAKDVGAWLRKHPEIIVTEAMRESGRRLQAQGRPRD